MVRPLCRYSFEGYWKDVGTLDSLWDANMDLLDPKDPINMRDPSFRIYARNYSAPATRISSSAKITNSFVAEGCTIRGSVEHSVLYTGCEIEEGAVVTGAVIMPNTIIRKGANVSYCIVGERCVIEEGAKIGERPENCPPGEWGGSGERAVAVTHKQQARIALRQRMTHYALVRQRIVKFVNSDFS